MLFFHSKWEEGHRAYWTGWWHITNRLSIEVDAAMFDSPSCGISIARGSRSIKLHIAIPWVISFWLKFGGVLPYGESRELGMSVHHWSIWFRFWVEPMDGKVRVWDIGDWIFGKPVYSSREREKREIVVPMPEKAYAATATLSEASWTFPRWFTTRVTRVEIDVPEGIPHEGKGENSWDCGTDATFGMTCAAKSIPEGVGKFVGSCLRDRVKYGGWGDWEWKK
jgi:hypothetical protein